MSQEKCDECGGTTKPDYERGEVVCEDCGLVLEDKMIEQSTIPEKGTPAKRANPTRRKYVEEILPGNFEAFVPVVEKRKISAEPGKYETREVRDATKEEKAEIELLKKKDMEDWFAKNPKAKKKHNTDLRNLRATKRAGFKKPIEEAGWDTTSEWKPQADAEKYLRNTKLEELGLTLVKLQDDMKHTIQGASKPERTAYIQKEGEMTPIKIHALEEASLEFYISMASEGPFWFFQDYCRLFPVDSETIDDILRSIAPLLSTQAVEHIDRIHHDCKITTEMMQRFTIRAGYALGFDTNGLERDRSPPLPYEGDLIPQSLKEKISLCARGGSDPIRIFNWAPFTEKVHKQIEGVEREATRGALRPASHPLLLTHIPLAYALAQRIRDSWRKTDQYRNISMRILNKIEEDLAWCPASVDEMDRWWDTIVDQSDSMRVSVTRLR